MCFFFEAEKKPPIFGVPRFLDLGGIFLGLELPAGKKMGQQKKTSSYHFPNIYVYTYIYLFFVSSRKSPSSITFPSLQAMEGAFFFSLSPPTRLFRCLVKVQRTPECTGLSKVNGETRPDTY